MRDYYASRAPEYDRVYLKPERQADLDAIRRWPAGAIAWIVNDPRRVPGPVVIAAEVAVRE